MEQKVFTIRQINQYIKSLLEMDCILQGFFVRGQISNFKRHTSGHLYFSLRDETGVISCVMFRSEASYVPFALENGMEVVAYGNVTIYEKMGQLQLYVSMIEPVGIGALQLAFEQRKEKLQKEGLFDPDFKRELPQEIKTIAVVTSATGAVIRDIIKVVKRRDPRIRIAIFPSLVQGETAATALVGAIRLANAWQEADVLIVARGGGSMEDLAAFNEESVARAIFASELPVISAVGHETDFTIADFVADVRASTPSVAAELVSTPLEQYLEEVAYLSRRLSSVVVAIFAENKRRLEYLSGAIERTNPQKLLQQHQQQLSSNERRMHLAMQHNLERGAKKLELLDSRLQALSPLRVMKKGYALVLDQNERVLNTISQVEIGDNIQLQLSDGTLFATVTKRKGHVNGNEKKADI
ncbi:MAG: exodeoxyribonuclease VII large subunit [Bacillota bacterium]